MTQRSPIQRLIDTTPLRCTLCAQPAGTCQCWEVCSCGHAAQRGRPCTNPTTTDCSTKRKYGTPAQQAQWFAQLGRQAAARWGARHRPPRRVPPRRDAGLYYGRGWCSQAAL